MNILAFILISLFLGGLYFFLGRVILDGLKTGKIRHTDSKSLCDKAKNPAGYWLLILWFAVIMLFCLIAWLKVLFRVLLG
ncbi:MAG: hypothetical protein HND56_09885 [Pseudomonadota bacterium]|jgi:hypothetical protein|nr:hypothetical protein [Pseudomonadota bacterium]QKK05980.1 MAG: hypothetical protein HND56_09885 [Pseudomonadota bacterium]|tara:strand:- start:581 stop:820 length:240 start_codon:yes stop_codon:yes gene_type:complete